METKVTFPKIFPGNFKVSCLLATFLFLASQVLPTPVLAYPFFRVARDGNPSAFPAGYVPEINFHGGQGAAVSCTKSQGRQYNFSYAYPFNLEGISFYILTTVGNQSTFDLGIFWLSVFPGESPNLKTTAPYSFRVSPTFKNVVAFDGRGNPTFEVFFPLEPIYLEREKIYTVILECQVEAESLYRVWESPLLETGLISSYFDSNTFSSRPYYALDRKIQQSLFFKNGNVQNRPIRVAKSLPPTRPVILVHGLGGRPGDFADYVDLLRSQSWDSHYLLSFDFGLKDGSYDNFADLADLVRRVEVAVATLSARHRADGGDGKVDLVGYSSGSLLARNYLALNKNRHSVRRFVSIGGTFKGSFLIDLEKGNENFPGAKTKLPLHLVKIFRQPLSELNPLAMGRVPRDELFKNQVVSTSRQVSSFKKEDLPLDVDYYSLQGDIKAKYTQKLFKFLVKSEGSLGDGAVLAESSSDLPNASIFSFEENLVVTRSISRSEASVSAKTFIPDFSKFNFFHSNLLRASEIKNKVLDLLR